jgi:nitrogen fixation protein FixH
MSVIERIPPRIRYPGLVLLLLGGAVLGQVYLVSAAFSGAGPQIVDDYYEQAVSYDENRRRLATSEALGWHSEVRLTADGDQHMQLELELRDEAGQPVDELVGSVELRRPSRADPMASASLERAERPGLYRMTFETPPRRGLWDIHIDAEHRRGPWVHERRLEVPR